MHLKIVGRHPGNSFTFHLSSITVICVLGYSGNALAFEGKYGVRSPKAYNGPCPTTLVFAAEFSSREPLEVDFSWTRSDGVTTASERLTLEETQPNRYFGRSELEWEVAPDGPKGQSFSVRVTPSTDPQGANSRPVHVFCVGAEENSSRDSTDESSPADSSANTNQWDLGDDEVPIVLGDSESDTTEPAEHTPAPQTQARQITTPQIFRCPVDVEIGAKPIPSGWRSSWNQQIVPYATQTISNNKMTCLYQKGRTLIPLTIPVPPKAKECSPSGKGFVCTMYK